MRAAGLIEGTRLLFVGIGSTDRAVRSLPPRAQRSADRDPQPAHRQPARNASRRRGGARRCRPARRADLCRADCDGDARPLPIRRGRHRRGGHLGALGDHRAHGGGGGRPARRARADRPRDPHRRWLQGRGGDADRGWPRAPGHHPRHRSLRARRASSTSSAASGSRSSLRSERRPAGSNRRSSR